MEFVKVSIGVYVLKVGGTKVGEVVKTDNTEWTARDEYSSAKGKTKKEAALKFLGY